MHESTYLLVPLRIQTRRNTARVGPFIALLSSSIPLLVHQITARIHRFERSVEQSPAARVTPFVASPPSCLSFQAYRHSSQPKGRDLARPIGRGPEVGSSLRTYRGSQLRHLHLVPRFTHSFLSISYRNSLTSLTRYLASPPNSPVAGPRHGEPGLPLHQSRLSAGGSWLARGAVAARSQSRVLVRGVSLFCPSQRLSCQRKSSC